MRQFILSSKRLRRICFVGTFERNESSSLGVLGLWSPIIPRDLLQIWHDCSAAWCAWLRRFHPLLVNETLCMAGFKFQVLLCVRLIQSTLALRTPRYYGHPANTYNCWINPRLKLQTFDWNKSRYYGFSLLRTYRHLSQSRQHNFIVLTLLTTDINQHLSTFWQNYLRL